MKTSFVVLASVGIASAVAPWTWSQGFDQHDSVQAIGSLHPFRLALIDDTKVRSAAAEAQGVGRYSITLFKSEAILLDSVTGETWVLAVKNGKNDPSLQWIPISKIAQARPKQPREDVRRGQSPNGVHEEHESDSSDPFHP